MFPLSAARHPAALHMTKLVPVSAVIWPRMPGRLTSITLFAARRYTSCPPTEEIQTTDTGFEPQQTPGRGKKDWLPFKAVGLSLVYKYMRYKLYIYILSEQSTSSARRREKHLKGARTIIKKRLLDVWEESLGRAADIQQPCSSKFLEWLQSVDTPAQRAQRHGQSRGKIRTHTWLA